jgi:hypothetical protein
MRISPCAEFGLEKINISSKQRPFHEGIVPFFLEIHPAAAPAGLANP